MPIELSERRSAHTGRVLLATVLILTALFIVPTASAAGP